MQGWFNSTLRGNKDEMMQLMKHLTEAVKDDEMFERVVPLIGEMTTLDGELVEVNIGMNEPDEFNWFCEDTYFYVIAKNFPDIELIGSVEYVNPFESTMYYCAPGSSDIEEVEVLGNETADTDEEPDFFSQFGSFFEESFKSFDQMESTEIDDEELKQLEKEMEQFCNSFAQNILSSIFEMTGKEPDVQTNFFCWQFNATPTPEECTQTEDDVSNNVITKTE